MNCPYCNVPLVGGMTVCPKCKYDINTEDGGLKHREWLAAFEEDTKNREEEIQKAAEALENEKRIRDVYYDAKKKMILSTCQRVDGYTTIEQYGLVFGEVAFKFGFLKSLGASFDNVADILTPGDNELSGTARLLESSREYAIDKMKTGAARLGANAIIGVDCESSFGGEIMHITIYGTAVKVIKN